MKKEMESELRATTFYCLPELEQLYKCQKDNHSFEKWLESFAIFHYKQKGIDSLINNYNIDISTLMKDYTINVDYSKQNKSDPPGRRGFVSNEDGYVFDCIFKKKD